MPLSATKPSGGFLHTAVVSPARYSLLTAINLAVNLVFLALYLAPLLIADRDRLAAAATKAHAPALDVLSTAPPLVLVHLVSVIAALLLGVVLMSGRKGVRLHRQLGWCWVACMAVAALSSVFLRGIQTGSFATGGFSIFHLITAFVVLVMPLAVLAARKHHIRWHAALMTYLLVNVLLSAGLLAMYPGFSERLLPMAMFGG